MPFNGSGVYTAPAASFPAVTGTVIDSSKYNNVVNDIATALTTCLTKDGQTTVTANLPMATYRHTGVGNATALTDYASADQVVDNALTYGGASAAGTDTYAVSLPISPGAYATGQRFQFKADVANASACTINFNSLGAKNIKLQSGDDPVSGAIQADQLVDLVYDGTDFIIQNEYLFYQQTQGITAFGFNNNGVWDLGTSCTAFGARALESSTVGTSNSAFGNLSLWQCSSGTLNTASGASSLYDLTTGSSNSAFGHNAGSTLTTGANNSFFGASATPTSATVSNEITLGNSSIATLRCQVTTITALSDERDKENILPLDQGLEFIKSLNPVSFDWNMRDGGKVGVKDTGFIAQELQAAQDIHGEIPGLVYDENPERLEAGYAKLLPVLVKAIQDLSREIEELKAT